MINKDAIDRFTLAHLALGYVLGKSGKSFRVATVAAIGWELVERPLKSSYPRLFPNPTQDSAANALLDVAAVLVGYAIATDSKKNIDNKPLTLG